MKEISSDFFCGGIENVTQRKCKKSEENARKYLISDSLGETVRKFPDSAK